MQSPRSISAGRFEQRLTIAFAAAVLVPLVSLSVVSYRLLSLAAMKQARAQIRSLAATQDARITKVLELNRDLVALVTSRTQLRISLQRYLQQSQTRELDRVHRILDDALEATSAVRRMSIVSRSGMVVASTDREWVGAPMHLNPAFMRGKREIVSGVLMPGPAGSSRLFLAGPLVSDDQLIGVALLEAEPGVILDVVQDRTGLGETGETILAERAPATGEAIFLAPLRFDPNAGFRRNAATGERAIPIHAALSGQQRFFEEAVDYRRVSVIAATRFIDEASWGLVVKIDRAEILAPVFQLRASIAVILGVSLIGVISFAVFGSHYFAQAFAQLAAAERSLRQSREALLSNRENLELSLDAASIGTWTWTIGDGGVAWDDQQHRLMGVVPGSFSGRLEDFLSLVHPDDRSSVESTLDRALEKIEPPESEFRVVLPDGSVRFICLSGRLVGDGSGNLVRVAGSCWDITGRETATKGARAHPA